MATDTFSPDTQQRFRGHALWKPWMTERRLRQITSFEDLREFLERGQDLPRISLDLETCDLSQRPESVCGVCLAFTEWEGVYIPIRHGNYPNQNLEPSTVWEMVLPLLREKQVVAYNWKFEGNILRRMGFHKICNPKNIQDGYLYRWLYNSDSKQLNLKDSTQELIGCEMLKIHEVPGIQFGKKRGQINFSLSDPSEATLYAAADPIFTLAVLDKCKPKVDKEQANIVLVEHRLLECLFQMEDNPVTIDRAFLHQAKRDLEAWTRMVARKVWDQAGEEFNLDSTREVARVLTRMGIPLPESEKGNLETNAKVLEPLADEYPIVADILFYRSVVKERTTYVEPLLDCTTEEKSEVVFLFKSPGAPTGRFSSGGVDEGDVFYAPMNVQAITSSASYRKAKVRKVSIPEVHTLGV